jgi:hypothetical protein
VVTRRQAALVEAQSRLDKLTDKHNELAIKTFSPREPRKNELSDAIEVDDLFGEGNSNEVPNAERTDKIEHINKSSKNNDLLPPNILDRSRSQLIHDQKEDVTLRNLGILNSAPEDLGPVV